jgi:hypothetical protein
MHRLRQMHAAGVIGKTWSVRLLIHLARAGGALIMWPFGAAVIWVNLWEPNLW